MNKHEKEWVDRKVNELECQLTKFLCDHLVIPLKSYTKEDFEKLYNQTCNPYMEDEPNIVSMEGK